MCELFAMSSRFPTTVDFSLERLARHGGLDGPHRDGWGVAYFDDHDVFLLREPRSASESELVKFMERNGPPSNLVVSHIRLATQGEPALRNTQPFQRELGGRVHVFAHNGRLPGIEDHCDFKTHRFMPVGDTDSEYAFCCLLERLTGHWDGTTDNPPSVDLRLQIVADFAKWLRPFGPSNFIYTDGDTLFAHAHRRTQKDGNIKPPGLHFLRRSCDEQPPDLTDSGVTLAPVQQQLVLVASVPLTDEPWEPLAEGEVIALVNGKISARSSTERTDAVKA